MAMPLQSMRYIVICAGGIVGFILLAIFPTYRAAVATDQRISQLEEKIEEQETLHPLFQDLLERSQQEAPSRLPLPKKAKLSRDETEGISDFFQKLAQKNRFEVESIVPDVVSLTDGSGYLKLDALMRGRFLNFRPLLIQLAEIPYLEHIESIQIKTLGTEKEVRLKLWIAQE